jgi:hypothetical protein
MMGVSDADIDHFREQLGFSGQNSIDAFLETRQEFLTIGKAAMSIILIRYEKPETLWRFENNNWLRYLFGRMRANTLEEFANNEVAFVTFNFDRSLEHFLFTSLHRTFGRKESEVAAVLSKIPLIHLHGRLGFLPWQKETSRPYSHQLSRELVEMCVSDIKLVHEELKDGRDKEFEEAKRLLMAADLIYLLGFGFGTVNISRLGLAGLPQNRAIATATGFTQHEVAALHARCGSKISIYPNHNIESLFREVVAWE